MLFSQRFWPGLADGTITRTYRRWAKPQVVAGRDYRSPGGMLHVESIRVIEPGTIGDEDALAAGYADGDALRRDLRVEPRAPVYEIVFRPAGTDPRDALAADDALDDAAVAEITRRLDRLDRASASGLWTREVLEAIGKRPGVRAGDLAAAFGRELQPFKLDVRKLKALGLTISLDVGYRLSPRGAAYARHTSSARRSPGSAR
ncbi:MAG: hypothetical protein AB7Q42_21740 [Acidimicrobiia bacterium]